MGNIDVFIAAQGTAPLSGSPPFANQAHLAVSTYASTAPGLLRVAATAPGTTTPIRFQANAPAGTAGTTTDNPIGGTSVAGTAMTVLVVPQSLPGSRAPFPFTAIQAISSLTSAADSTATAVTPAPHNLSTGSSVIINGADTAVYNGTFTVTVVNPSTFTYKMSRATTGSPARGYPFWLPRSAGPSFNGLPISRLTSTGTTATVVTQGSHGLATNDIVSISGANQAEYNGSFVVTKVNATTVTYTTNGAPGASPATGAPVWRRGGNDFTGPNMLFLIDLRPPNTAP